MDSDPFSVLPFSCKKVKILWTPGSIFYGGGGVIISQWKSELGFKILCDIYKNKIHNPRNQKTGLRLVIWTEYVLVIVFFSCYGRNKCPNIDVLLFLLNLFTCNFQTPQNQGKITAVKSSKEESINEESQKKSVIYISRSSMLLKYIYL